MPPLGCPNCSASTDRRAFGGEYGPDVEVDPCFACRVTWLDPWESFRALAATEAARTRADDRVRGPTLGRSCGTEDLGIGPLSRSIARLFRGF